MKKLWPLALVVVLAACSDSEKTSGNGGAKAKGDECLQNDDLDGAVAAYSDAIAADPNMQAAYNNRGVALQRQGQTDKAIADFTKAIDLNAADARPHANRGWSYRTKGDLAKARTDLDEAVKLDPKFAVAAYRRGMVRWAQKDLAGAEADLKSATALAPESAAAWTALAEVRVTAGSPDAAIEAADAGLKGNAGCASLLNARGLAWYAKKDFARAGDDFSAALKTDAEHRNARFNRALVCCELKKYAEAIADLDEAVRLSPKNPDAWKLRGYAKFAAGKGDDAVPDYKKALEVAPKDWPDRKEIEEWLKKDEKK